MATTYSLPLENWHSIIEFYINGAKSLWFGTIFHKDGAKVKNFLKLSLNLVFQASMKWILLIFYQTCICLFCNLNDKIYASRRFHDFFEIVIMIFAFFHETPATIVKSLGSHWNVAIKVHNWNPWFLNIIFFQE